MNASRRVRHGDAGAHLPHLHRPARQQQRPRHRRAPGPAARRHRHSPVAPSTPSGRTPRASSPPSSASRPTPQTPVAPSCWPARRRRRYAPALRRSWTPSTSEREQILAHARAEAEEELVARPAAPGPRQPSHRASEAGGRRREDRCRRGRRGDPEAAAAIAASPSQ